MVTSLTEIERRIFEELSRIDQNIADIYYGAIFAFKETSIPLTTPDSSINESKKLDLGLNPDRLAQAAHSLRETLTVLLRKIDIPEQENAFREKIKKYADPVGELPKILHGLFDELFDLHNWFVSVSHHGRRPTEIEFLRKLEKFNSALLRVLIPHFESIAEMDSLLLIPSPTIDDIEKILPLMSKNYSSYSHFFVNANSNWVELLKNKGFFKDPPIPKHNGEFIQYYTWPESHYLSKIASEKPQIVYTIINECQISRKKEEQNPRVFEDFVNAAINMPCDYAEKMARLIIKNQWRDTRSHSLLDEKISNLMTKLSDCNKLDSSIALGDMLLDVDVIESQGYGGILDIVS